jgi:hypothetical protein
MAERPTPRRFPVLWELNARTTVRAVGEAATLDDLDGPRLDQLVPRGVDWLYLLGVWQTGAAGREVSRSQPEIRRACEEALPDLTDADICGSCFAITSYQVNEHLGGEEALARFRSRLADRGTRLMLDFVPNHTALDHPWVGEHPEYYIEGNADDLLTAPGDWIRLEAGGVERVLAYGRDPYFPGWPDTLQLDYSRPSLQAAMTDALVSAAGRCDGLRCDMAMLLLPDVFERTWGRSMPQFWPTALSTVRAEQPGFVFMAEVYWDREYDLQQQGFDATYDKRLYDRLVGDLTAVRGHLCADADYQARSARFLENHDEPRAATVFGTDDRHRSAAVITYLVPGVRFLQDGQREARRIHAPVHLCRAPDEPDRGELRDFYDDLLALLVEEPVVHDGDWQLLDIEPAWPENGSWTNLVASSWATTDGELRYLVAVNLAATRSQGYIRIPRLDLAGRTWTLDDRLGPERYERDGSELLDRGLYIDLAPWGHNVFGVEPCV